MFQATIANKRHVPRILGALGLCLLLGCSKRDPGTSQPPSAGASAGPEGDDLVWLEQQLAERGQQLAGLVGPVGPGHAAGGDAAPEAEIKTSDSDEYAAEPATHQPSRPTTTPAPRTRRDAPLRRCEQVCEISAAICELSRQICDLAPRHPGEVRYQAACERATTDCHEATEACHACTD